MICTKSQTPVSLFHLPMNYPRYIVTCTALFLHPCRNCAGCLARSERRRRSRGAVHRWGLGAVRSYALVFSLYSKSDLHFAIRAWTQSFMASLNLQGSHMPPQRCQSQERTCDYCILYSFVFPISRGHTWSKPHLVCRFRRTCWSVPARRTVPWMPPTCWHLDVGSWMIIRITYRYIMIVNNSLVVHNGYIIIINN